MMEKKIFSNSDNLTIFICIMIVRTQHFKDNMHGLKSYSLYLSVERLRQVISISVPQLPYLQNGMIIDTSQRCYYDYLGL